MDSCEVIWWKVSMLLSILRTEFWPRFFFSFFHFDIQLQHSMVQTLISLADPGRGAKWAPPPPPPPPRILLFSFVTEVGHVSGSYPYPIMKCLIKLGGGGMCQRSESPSRLTVLFSKLAKQYPLGLPWFGPDLWKRKSNCSIFPYFCKIFSSVYLKETSTTVNEWLYIKKCKCYHMTIHKARRRAINCDWMSSSLVRGFHLQFNWRTNGSACTVHMSTWHHLQLTRALIGCLKPPGGLLTCILGMCHARDPLFQP